MSRVESAFLPEHNYILLLRGVCSLHTGGMVADEHGGQHRILELLNRVRDLGIGVCAIKRSISTWLHVSRRGRRDLHTESPFPDCS